MVAGHPILLSCAGASVSRPGRGPYGCHDVAGLPQHENRSKTMITTIVQPGQALSRIAASQGEPSPRTPRDIRGMRESVLKAISDMKVKIAELEAALASHTVG